MAEGPILGLDRPFVEEEEDTLKLIFQFADFVTKTELREKTALPVQQIQNDGFEVSDIRVDEGMTPFLVLDMLSTNLDFENIVKIEREFNGIEGYKGMTISTVDVAQIERFAQMR